MINEEIPAYEAVGLTKHFGHIEACTDVDVSFYRGEITAIVGDNGAGKSTLVKMLTGAISPDAGELFMNGKQTTLTDPLDARKQGLEVVYQELALAPNLDVAANVFLGRELTKYGPLRMLDRKRMIAKAKAEIQTLNIDIPAATGLTVGAMSGGQRQCVAIARAAYWTRDVVLMDEPTAALGLRETRAVNDLIKAIRDRGIAIGLISHSLPQVEELADRVVVLRHGRKVADLREDRFSVPQLMHLILEGRPAEQ